MITCPRCNLEQDESPRCEYCGLDFSTPEPPSRNARFAGSKWAAFLVLIIFVFGASFTAYRFFSSETAPPQDPQPARVKDSGRSDKDLHQAVRDLSGDVGIVSEFTGGSTKGSVLAMVFFSIVGLGYLTYGKKSQQLLMVVCGIGLMGYSYFIDGTIYIILVGLVLSALPFVLARK